MPKHINLANVPEARPIEDFWAIIKKIVYKNGWTAQNIDKLKDRIRWAFRNIDVKVVQQLASTVHNRLDQVRRYGPIIFFCDLSDRTSNYLFKI